MSDFKAVRFLFSADVPRSLTLDPWELSALAQYDKTDGLVDKIVTDTNDGETVEIIVRFETVEHLSIWAEDILPDKFIPIAKRIP